MDLLAIMVTVLLTVWAGFILTFIGIPQDIAHAIRTTWRRRKALRVKRQAAKREESASLDRYNAGLGSLSEFRVIPGTVHGTLPKCLCEHWYIVHDTGGYQCKGDNGRCECVTYMGPDPMLSGLWSPTPKPAIEPAPTPTLSLGSMSITDLQQLAKQTHQELETRGIRTLTDWYSVTTAGGPHRELAATTFERNWEPNWELADG